MKAKDSSVKLVASAAIGVAMAFGVQAASAATYTITSGDVVTLTNVLFTKAGDGSTIELEPGVYDLSKVGSTKYNDYARSHLCAYAKQLIIRGMNTKHWSKKTRDEETILKGDGTATIFYCHGGVGRKTSFHNLTFDGGCYTEGTQAGGGGICCAATESYDAANGYQIATNCVFRNCSNAKNNTRCGGGTCNINVFDCYYTNCIASKGGGAYGECNNNSQFGYYTNIVANCVFEDCVATNGLGGGVFLRHNDHITGCTFKNCRATRSSDVGGAFFANGTRLVEGCTFINCSGRNGGGVGFAGYDAPEGVSDYKASVGMITNCTFDGNSAASGGGMYFFETSVCDSIVDCKFSDCEATNGSGGGIYFAASAGNIIDCTFTNCSVKGIGGGVHAVKAVSSVVGSSFRNCKGDVGGALSVGESFGVATNCVFADNVAEAYAGAYVAKASGSFVDCHFSNNTNSGLKTTKIGTSNYSVEGSHLEGAESVVGCTFSGWGDTVACQYDRCTFDGCRFFPNDTASYYDGMVAFQSARLPLDKEWFIRNCLFTKCDTSVIIYNNSCRQLTVDNCTFVSNSLSTFGNHDGYIGYVMRATHADSNLVIGGTNVFNNCIFWENSNKTADGTKYRHDARFYGTNTGVANKLYAVTAITNCIYGGDTAPFYGGSTLHYEGNFDKVADVKFVGGGSPQRYAGRPFYSLRAGSPARERGKWLGWMDAETSTDLSGNPRIVGKLPDIGCYEYQPFNLGLMLFVQ